MATSHRSRRSHGATFLLLAAVGASPYIVRVLYRRTPLDPAVRRSRHSHRGRLALVETTETVTPGVYLGKRKP